MPLETLTIVVDGVLDGVLDGVIDGVKDDVRDGVIDSVQDCVLVGVLDSVLHLGIVDVGNGVTDAYETPVTSSGHPWGKAPTTPWNPRKHSPRQPCSAFGYQMTRGVPKAATPDQGPPVPAQGIWRWSHDLCGRHRQQHCRQRWNAGHKPRGRPSTLRLGIRRHTTGTPIGGATDAVCVRRGCL